MLYSLDAQTKFPSQENLIQKTRLCNQILNKIVSPHSLISYFNKTQRKFAV